MLDSLSLDHLRVFVAIADHGGFSAAARRLNRAQSAISNAIANLERTLNVTLFDRSGWKPTLTAHGKALLVDARTVLARADQLKTRALGLTQGLETELSVVLDVMFPTAKLVNLVINFQKKFPGVSLRLCIDVLGGVPDKVINNGYDIGVQGLQSGIDPVLTSHVLDHIILVPTAAPQHALAQQRDIFRDDLLEQTQIVLTDHSGRTNGRSISVFSNRNILTSDLGSKRTMLLAGLGWGFMPRTYVEDDLNSGLLVELDLADPHQRRRSKPLFAIYKRDIPLGPAGKWVLDLLLAGT